MMDDAVFERLEIAFRADAESQYVKRSIWSICYFSG
jgi:hypothetical protein